MDKKILLVMLLLICLSSFGFADIITEYTFPENVPLNQKVTLTGVFDSNAGKNGIICSFYLLDKEAKLVYRASDEYTSASGRFTMRGVTMSEPLFVRGETYTLHTECAGASADGNFVVGQKQEAFDIFGYKFYPQSVGFDLVYFNNMDYTFAILIALFVLGVLVFLGRSWLKTFF